MEYNLSFEEYSRDLNWTFILFLFTNPALKKIQLSCLVLKFHGIKSFRIQDWNDDVFDVNPANNNSLNISLFSYNNGSGDGSINSAEVSYNADPLGIKDSILRYVTLEISSIFA